MVRQVAVEVASLLVPWHRLPRRWPPESPHAVNELVKEAVVQYSKAGAADSTSN
jgi:hypothetical protein